MKKNNMKKISILILVSFLLLTTKTFAASYEEDMLNSEMNYRVTVESENSTKQYFPLGYDDDVIYGYTLRVRQSYPNFAQVIRGYEITRHGLKFRGDLYFQYSGGSAGDYYGVYEGDLYYAGRAR